MALTRKLKVMIPLGQTPMMSSHRRLTRPLKRSLSKFKKLLHIPDRQGRFGEDDLLSCPDSTPRPTNTTFPFMASLSTITEISETTEYYHSDNMFPVPSIFIPSVDLAPSSVGHRNRNLLSVSTVSTTPQTSPITSPSYSPSQYFKHCRTSFDNTTTSTVSSIFNAYEEEGITNDPVRIITELEMYVPVTSAMVRILLTKGHLFPGHALATTRLAMALKASCDEVSTFLSEWDSLEATSLYDFPSPGLLDDYPARMEPAGQFHGCTYPRQVNDFRSTRFARGEAKVKSSGNHRSLHDIIRSGKQNFKCGIANLMLRMPTRGPRWLMDRVLLWTIVRKIRAPSRKLCSRNVVVNDAGYSHDWMAERQADLDAQKEEGEVC